MVRSYRWGGVVVAHVIIVSPPVPQEFGFFTSLGLGLGLGGQGLGLGLDNFLCQKWILESTIFGDKKVFFYIGENAILPLFSQSSSVGKF